VAVVIGPTFHVRDRAGTVIEFPAPGARAIECHLCGRRFEATTPKRTALAYREHRCGNTEPFDWDDDTEIAGTLAVHLRLTPLELNHMLAWLEHPAGPEFMHQIGRKVRTQIERDSGHLRSDLALLAVSVLTALAVAALALALP
jgi:hypothetical protein